ncbi:LacI family DNA-binding transcriptional regulator [Enterococcus sp. BWT-B8]|uniref:LacI family DNA-binding transcriptional regulator n=1 Tax=unclassified Enterococcus TaxID=2608891 RepID=UPI001E434E57|nr:MULTISPECIES: LacI family DNA-binding transcriptional regulator [unclassified Enterococcus]MCB5952883.1 LacI family DNA-binding transcriptional regulator [Enterococcus sp. BWT-B8]MCB5953896.1 LacI family DNA-binding transcriptional regulator [Enterococcus sp. CWB-B31]
MVTIKDVAKESGYSQATISRLFKGDETLAITSKAKNKIIATALALGYDRSKIKTTLHKIAVLFWLSETKMMEDIYFNYLKEELFSYSKAANMALEFVSKSDGIEAIPQDVTGFIAIGPITKKELLALHKKGYKGVVRGINPLPKFFDTVESDIQSMTREAIDYFLEAGLTKIGFIGGAFQNPDTMIDEMDSREYVFREYLTQKGLFNEDYVFSGGEFSVEQGYELAKQMADNLSSDLPEACFVASDTIAVGVLQGFHEKGILLPEQIAIISINDYEIAKYVSPPLTTFHINVKEMAKTTIDQLSDQLVYPRTITKKVLLDAELTVRKSFIPIETNKNLVE